MLVCLNHYSRISFLMRNLKIRTMNIDMNTEFAYHSKFTDYSKLIQIQSVRMFPSGSCSKENVEICINRTKAVGNLLEIRSDSV